MQTYRLDLLLLLTAGYSRRLKFQVHLNPHFTLAKDKLPLLLLASSFHTLMQSLFLLH
jgi:hypothetical protein